jgi:hypothetical protein
MSAAADAVLRAGEALRHVRTSSGDLTFRDLDLVYQGLSDSKVNALAALAEGGKAPTGAEEFMAKMGGPATLADFQVKLEDIETKAAAFHAEVTATFAAIPSSSLIAVKTRNLGGVTVPFIERGAFIPATYANPLRTSAALADLQAAFEAVGA